MKFLIKCKDCVYGSDDLEDVALIIDREWDGFLGCEEREYGDIFSGGNGRFWDVTEKACREWIRLYSGKAQIAFGELWVPKLVRFHCQEDVEQIEGEIEAEEDWLGEAVRDHRHSVGIQFNR